MDEITRHQNYPFGPRPRIVGYNDDGIYTTEPFGMAPAQSPPICRKPGRRAFPSL
ncbi:MAG: hypothetical protein KAT26_06015 [Marinosulfonomonas sp.]|nr:hypothetical protein [Marinosulfonomonas sp.]